MFAGVIRVPALVVALSMLAFAAPARADLSVTWMRGASSPGTPARYDKVPRNAFFAGLMRFLAGVG